MRLHHPKPLHTIPQSAVGIRHEATSVDTSEPAHHHHTTTPAYNRSTPHQYTTTAANHHISTSARQHTSTPAHQHTSVLATDRRNSGNMHAVHSTIPAAAALVGAVSRARPARAARRRLRFLLLQAVPEDSPATPPRVTGFVEEGMTGTCAAELVTRDTEPPSPVFWRLRGGPAAP
jgi:hypothetical protein